MQEPELSVIIPVMNIENRICDVLNTLKEDTKGFSVEFLKNIIVFCLRYHFAPFQQLTL